MKTWLRKRRRTIFRACLIGLLVIGIVAGWTRDQGWPSPDGTMTVRTNESFLAILGGRTRSKAVLISNSQKAAPKLVFDASAPLLDEGAPEIIGVLWQSNSRRVLIVHRGFVAVFITACEVKGPNLEIQQVQEKKWIKSVINENLNSPDPAKRQIAGTVSDGYDLWPIPGEEIDYGADY